MVEILSALTWVGLNVADKFLMNESKKDEEDSVSTSIYEPVVIQERVVVIGVIITYMIQRENYKENFV